MTSDIRAARHEPYGKEPWDPKPSCMTCTRYFDTLMLYPCSFAADDEVEQWQAAQQAAAQRRDRV